MIKLSSALCLLAVSMVGCADFHSSSNDSHNSNPQASTGTPSQSTPTTAPGTTTAPVIDGFLSVTITDGPKEGVTVLFHDFDGNVIGRAVTDANGLAVAPNSIAPVQVTALLGYAGFHQAVTWTGVEKGDALKVRNISAPTSANVSYALTMPGAFTNAVDYSAGLAPCFEEGMSSDEIKHDAAAPIAFQTCWSSQNAAIVRAKNGDTFMAYAYAKDLAAPTGLNTPIALKPWVTPSSMQVVTLNYDMTYFNVTEIVEQDVGGTLYDMDTPDTPASVLADPTYHPTMFYFAPGFADRFLAHTVATHQQGTDTNRLGMKVVVDETGGTVDYNQALPEMILGNADLSDTTRPAYTWASVTPLTSPDTGADGGMVSFTWGSSAFSTGGAVQYSPDSGAWHIYVMPGATSAKAPILPTDVAAWLPAAASVGAQGVRFEDADFIPNYAGYRAQIASIADLEPQTTAVRTTSWGNL